MPRPDIPDWVCPMAIVSRKGSADTRVIISVGFSHTRNSLEVGVGTTLQRVAYFDIAAFLEGWHWTGAWQSFPERSPETAPPQPDPRPIPHWMRQGVVVRGRGGRFVINRVEHTQTGARVVVLQNFGAFGSPTILPIEEVQQFEPVATAHGHTDMPDPTAVAAALDVVLPVLKDVASSIGLALADLAEGARHADMLPPEWLFAGALVADRDMHEMPTVVQEVWGPSDGLPGLVRVTQSAASDVNRSGFVLTVWQAARRFRSTGVDAFADELDHRTELPTIWRDILNKAGRASPSELARPALTVYDQLIAEDNLKA